MSWDASDEDTWDRWSTPKCSWCREPFLDGGEAQRFCVTCDRWIHIGCMERHATVKPDGDGDWTHVAGARVEGRGGDAGDRGAARSEGREAPQPDRIDHPSFGLHGTLPNDPEDA